MKIVKKTLAVLILLVLFGSNYLQAQCTCTESPGIGNQLLLCENFESYTNGSNFPFNNSRWGFWPGTSTFGKIQTAPSSNSKALLVQHNGSTGSDLLLKLGNRTTGSYRISWQMYIPKGKSADYNFQQNETGGFWGFQVNFDGNGIGTVTRLRKTASRFPYLTGAWNNIVHIVNLNTGQMELWINDEFVDSWQFGYGNTETLFYSNANILAAINFYAPANAAFYVDNICMEQAGPPIFFNVFPICLKNGQSLIGEESTFSLYTVKERSNESCRNICSFAGLNVKNSLKYDDQSGAPASKINDASILPNQILNLPCLQYLFPTYSRKQLRGQIYPFTATSPTLNIDLVFQVGSKDNVSIALIECNGSFYPPCELDQNTNGLRHTFENLQNGKTYNIIIIAVETVEFTIEISFGKIETCYDFVTQDKVTACICKEASTTLRQSTTLNNVNISGPSETKRVFPDAINKVYSGGEKAYRITIDQPSLVNFTLSSANQGYIMFLAGSDCTDNLLALNSTPDIGGTANISKALEAGVYHLIVDQLRANTTSISTFRLIYTVSALDPVSRASNSDCPINPNNAHQVTIRSSPLLLDGSELTPSDRIYLVNSRNKDNRESNAANWIGQQINFTLYEDANSDKLNCGYVDGDLIEFVIIRQNTIYYVRPIFQPEDGTDITAGNRFKKGGKSLIIGFVSNLNISNLGLASSIPTLTASANNFFVAINSNESWRIERANPNKPSWVSFNPQQGSTIELDVQFQISANQSTRPRVDTLFLINDQGFYKSIVITQPGCTGPSVNAGMDQPICPGQNAKLTASGVGTITWQNPGSISNPSFTTPTLNTTQTFTAYATIGGCTASDQVTVNVLPKPNANAGPDTSICAGSKISLTASGEGTYTWSTGATTEKLEVNPTTTTTYTLTVTSKGGCTATDQVVVVVNRAFAKAGTDRSIICRGDSTTLQASGGKTYLWSNGKTSPSIKVSPTSDQVYQVTVTDNNCPATASVKVTVTPLPQASAGLSQTICTGQAATLSASGGGTYLWNTTADTQIITVSPTQSTDYTVTVTQNGCSNTAQVRVTVNSATANAGPDQSICAGQSVMLTASGGGTYQWSTNADTASITLSPNQTQTYTVTVTQNACSATDQVTVTVRPLPIVNAGLDQNICIGESALLTASGVGTYKWSTTASTSSITVAPLGTQTFSVTATQEGCTASDEVVVTVKPLPSANAGPDLNICAGQNAVLNASGGSLYKWSTSDTTSAISLVPTNTQTFTVTVTQDACESTDQVLVTVKPLPTANAGPDQSICAGQSTMLNATGGSAYKWSGNLTTASITISPIGTQLFTVTVTQNDCEATDEVLVTVKPLPSANAGPDQSICAGQNVALTASGGSTYKWSTTATTSSISLTPLATQVFKVTVTQDACEATDEVQVEVKALPAANAGADISICAGQNAVLNASGGSSYRWNTNAAVASITVSPTQTQKYTVTVSQNACEASDEVVVTVKALPNANAGPDQSICAGQSAILNAAGGGTYKWSTNASTTSITVNPLSAQIFTVSVAQDGCTASDEVLVTVKPLPSANAGPDQSVCAGQSVALTASGGSTYKWSTTATTSSIALTPLATQVFKVTVTQDACEATDEVQVEVKALPAANAGADISICAGQNAVLNASGGSSYRWSTNAAVASITVNPTQTQKYTVTVSQNACEAIDEVVVTVKALPNANAGLDQSICIGQSATLIATGGGSYKWNTNSSTSSITVNPSATQIFTVSVTQDGCTASDEVLVTIKPLPSANAGPDQSICAGQSALLTASGGSGYKWNTNATASSITVVPGSTETFTVTVTQNGCEATDQLTVTVRPLPVANAGLDQSICAGQSAVLTASGGSGYKWNNNATASSITVLPANTETFAVTVTQNGCEATDQLTVTVRPLPTANAGPDQSICAGQSAVLTALGGSSYKWNNSATASSITVVPGSTETFTVTVTQNGCEATDQLTVTVRPLPIANAGPDLSICAKQSAVLSATGGNLYQWSNNATTASITISPAATQVFTVTVTQNECQSVDEVRVTVRPLPNANAGPDQSICAGQSTVLNATGGVTYKWSTNATTANISVNPLATQSYTLTVTQNDCEAIDQVIITVNTNPSITKDSSQFKAGPNSYIAVSVTGGKAPYQYQWFRNDTLTSAQEDLIGLKTGIYKLTIQDANGCSAGFGPERFIITSTRDVAGVLDLKVYPNPTQGQFRIEGKLSKKETVQVRILDATGKYIWKSDIKTATEFLYTPDLSNLAPGIYLIQLDVSGDLGYRKLIVH